MASDEAASAASDDAASDDAASDDTASDDMTSGPLVFRSTILQEHYSYFRSDLTSGALFLFSSKLPSGASKLQILLFALLFICSFRTNDDVTL